MQLIRWFACIFNPCLTSFLIVTFNICYNLAKLHSIDESSLTHTTIKKALGNDVQTWEANHCIFQLAKRLICQRTPFNCTSYQHKSPLPIVAIVAASTTRKNPSIRLTNFPLFTILLPSLARTLECGYQYFFVLGYDSDDKFYSQEKVTFHPPDTLF